MAINRAKKIREDEEIKAVNLEKSLDEISQQVPSPSEYRVNVIERTTVTKAPPSGMNEGEIRIDASGSTKKLVVCITVDGIKQMFEADLSLIS